MGGKKGSVPRDIPKHRRKTIRGNFPIHDGFTYKYSRGKAKSVTEKKRKKQIRREIIPRREGECPSPPGGFAVHLTQTTELDLRGKEEPGEKKPNTVGEHAGP